MIIKLNKRIRKKLSKYNFLKLPNTHTQRHAEKEREQERARDLWFVTGIMLKSVLALVTEQA